MSLDNRPSTVHASEGPPPFKRPRVSECSTFKTRDISGQVQLKQERSAQARASKAARCKSSLSLFKQLPLDIIFEITSKLEPVDLLALSRLSRAFHELFKNRHLWIASRSNIPGIPECPPDLNEAQYAFLLFGSECQACGLGCQSSSVDYALRIRACSKCFKQIVRKGPLDYQKMGQGKYNLFSLVPRAIPRYSLDSYERLVSLKNSAPSCKENGPRDLYYREELDAVLKHCLQLRDEELDEFIRQRQELAQQMFKSGFEMMCFVKQRQINLRDQRTLDIQAKLQLQGWSPSDFPQPTDGYSAYFRWRDLVNQDKPLTTPGQWKYVMQKLIAILRSVKLSRIETEERARRVTRRASLQLIWPEFIEYLLPKRKHPLPDQYDYESLPSVKRMIEDPSPNPSIVFEQLVSVANEIGRDMDSAISVIQSRFASLISPTPNPDILELPLAIFTCRRCSSPEPMTFSDVLRHMHTVWSSVWDVNHWDVSHFALDQSTSAKVLVDLLVAIQAGGQVDRDILGGCFRCDCGHPDVKGKNLDFNALFLHVHNETLWYSYASLGFSTLPNTNYLLLNDHARDKLRDHVKVLPSGAMPEPVIPQVDMYAYEAHSCRICAPIASYLNKYFETTAHRAYHLKAKHNLDDEKEYIQYGYEHDYFGTCDGELFHMLDVLY